MAYIIADTDYDALVENLAKLIADHAEPVAAGAPVDPDAIRMTLALAAGVYPHSAASDGFFDWHEAPPRHTEARV